jgi:hypothetical protein
MHLVRFLALTGLIALPTLAQSQSSSLPPLPDGRWTGSITTKTVPDVDKDGEWDAQIALEKCSGRTRIRFKKDDGSYTDGIDLTPLPFIKTYWLISSSVERQDGSGWVETQVWTLVDARPKGWTIAQSRSVINQDMKPDDPWFTFNRLAWGSLEYDPNGCPAEKK